MEIFFSKENRILSWERTEKENIIGAKESRQALYGKELAYNPSTSSFEEQVEIANKYTEGEEDPAPNKKCRPKANSQL